MTRVTQAEIEQLRSELQDYPNAITALQEIERCEGDLEDAVEVLALELGEKEEEQAAWLDYLINKCRKVICKEPIKVNVPTIVGSVTKFLVEELGCNPIVAAGIGILVSQIVKKVGIDKFCESTLPE